MRLIRKAIGFSKIMSRLSLIEGNALCWQKFGSVKEWDRAGGGEIRSLLENGGEDFSVAVILNKIDGKEVSSLRDEVGAFSKLYYCYPDVKQTLQIYEENDCPADDELRDLVPFRSSARLGDSGVLVFYKSQPGQELLSAKFNPRRAPEFDVSTFIYRGMNGLCVIKRPRTSEAKEHLYKMLSGRELLGRFFPGVDFIDVRREGDGLEFPFIEGERLDKGLDPACDPIEKIREVLDRILDEVLEFSGERVLFEETEQFRNIFRGVSFRSDEPCFPVINLDSNIDNFRRVKERLVCLDYEWVADFPVPVRFVRFRALYCYYRYNVRSLKPRISMKDFMALFGFSANDFRTFLAMEQDFQLYVLGVR